MQIHSLILIGLLLLSSAAISHAVVDVPYYDEYQGSSEITCLKLLYIDNKNNAEHVSDDAAVTVKGPEGSVVSLAISKGLCASATASDDSSSVFAYGELNDNANTLFFQHLNIQMVNIRESEITARDRMYFIGYIEGYLTHKSTAQFVDIIVDVDQKYLSSLMEFMSESIQHTRAFVASGTDTGDNKIVGAVADVLARFDGFYDAVTHPSFPENSIITQEQLWLLNSDADVFDLETKIDAESDIDSAIHEESLMTSMMNRKNKKEKKNTNEMSIASLLKRKRDGTLNKAEKRLLLEKIALRSRCSLLIRYLKDKNEILFGHATWEEYEKTLKMVKQISIIDANGRNVSFSYSSYPGILSSTDDFIIIDNEKLVIMETSLSDLNVTNYEKIAPDNGLLSWIRFLAASAIAKSGQEWIDYYSSYDSGTGAAQWTVLDFEVFSETSNSNNSSESLPDSTFLILESMGGYNIITDYSQQLYERGYFSGQNTPLSNEIRSLCGFENYEEEIVIPTPYHDSECYNFTSCKCTDSYDNNPRGCIFKRDAKNVETVDDMQKILRHNQYQTDPLSLGSPANAIASRYDLPIVGKIKKPKMFGATDAKMGTSSDLSQQLYVGGPTVTDQCPVFKWPSFNKYSKILPSGKDYPWFAIKSTAS